MIEQRSAEWYAQRCGKLTASSFGDLMAMTRSGPSTSRANLLARLACERMTGMVDEGYSNAAMERGIALEAEAADAYAFERGVELEPAEFVVMPHYAYIGCSPDRYVGDEGLVEIKCPAAMAKHLDALRTGGHAKEYRWQLQGQLMVTGRKWVDATSYDPRYPPNLQLAIVRVKRDEAAIDELRAACATANIEIDEIVAELSSMRAAA